MISDQFEPAVARFSILLTILQILTSGMANGPFLSLFFFSLNHVFGVINLCPIPSYKGFLSPVISLGGFLVPGLEMSR